MGRVARAARPVAGVAGLVVMVGALGACRKHGKAPPSPLQDGAPSAAVADAPPLPPDAPAAREAPTATKVVVGPHAACAVMSDATVRCWGGNSEGELGDGTTRSSTVPVNPNLRGIKDLVLGDGFACALVDDSSVTCWGQIGYGKERRTLVPAAAPGVRGIVRIFAVGGAACATARSGALVCWGDVDTRGHITATGASHAPTPVPGVDHVVLLTAHAAVTESRELVAWTDGGAPVATGLGPMTELAERELPCALVEDGDVDCIADHATCGAPIIGKSTPARRADPRATKKKAKKPSRSRGRIKTRTKPKPAPATAAAAKPLGYVLPGKALHLAFDTGSCVVSTARRFDCIDLGDACKVTRPWPALVTVVETSGPCARLADGTVRCGTPGAAAAPLIAGVTGAVQLSASAARGCALTKDHSVLCWEGTAGATPIVLR